MNDENINEGLSPAEAEAKRRAERIKAIRQSIHGGEPTETKAASASVPAEKPAETSAWDDEIAARIAKRVQKVKQSKASGAESIISELDAANSESDVIGVIDRALAETQAASCASAQSVLDELEAEKAAVQQQESVSAETAEEIVPGMAEKVLPDFTEEASQNKTEETAAVVPMRAAEETIDNAALETPEAPKAPVQKKKKKKKKSFKERFLSLFPQKKDSVGERIRKLVFCGALILTIVCGYQVGDYYIDLWTNKKRNTEVMNMYWTYTPKNSTSNGYTYTADVDDRPVYTLLDGAKKLLDKNSDVVGVIRIEGTPVNNPVMQSNDNAKYLDKNIDMENSRSGEIFLDYRNHFDDCDEEGHLREANSDNLVIYGHNMGNDTMFGSLKYYERYEKYYEEHPVIELNSNYNCYTYKIFAFFILDAEDESDTRFDCWNTINFNSEDDFYNFVNEAKRRTIRLNDVDVQYGDRLLTLSTCNTILGDRGRLIVMARLVRDGEDPYEGTANSVYNNNIKWPNLYYQYSKSNKRYDPEAEFAPYSPEN